MSTTTTSGESLEQEFRPAWTAYSKTIWLTILTSPFLFGTPMIYAWWARRNTTYRVTDQAVVKEWSGFSSKREQINRGTINRVRASQSFFERLRNKGTVTVADTSGQELVVRGIGDHRRFVDALE